MDNLLDYNVWHNWATIEPRPADKIRHWMADGAFWVLPYFEDMVGCPQDPKFHPEGDVFNHVCYVIEAITEPARACGFPPTGRALMYAALLHDIAKPITTVWNEEYRKWTSPGHARAGVAYVNRFFHTLQAPANYAAVVGSLVAEHMYNPEPLKLSSLQRLDNRLGAASLNMWAILVNADLAGRPPLAAVDKSGPVLDAWRAWKNNDGLSVPFLRGQDIIDAGLALPGPIVGHMLRAVEEAKSLGLVDDKVSALTWLKEQLVV